MTNMRGRGFGEECSSPDSYLFESNLIKHVINTSLYARNFMKDCEEIYCSHLHLPLVSKNLFLSSSGSKNPKWTGFIFRTTPHDKKKYSCWVFLRTWCRPWDPGTSRKFCGVWSWENPVLWTQPDHRFALNYLSKTAESSIKLTCI